MIALDPLDNATLIREVYRRRQREYDDLVTTVAEEVHSDAVNDIIIPSLMELRSLMRTIPDADVCERIRKIMQEQRRLVRILRGFADRLYPTGSSDAPFGFLCSVKQRCFDWSQQREAPCTVDVEGPEIPTTIAAQRAAARIVDAALASAAHRAARKVSMQLVYPHKSGEGLNLIIGNDGQYAVEDSELVRWNTQDIRESVYEVGGHVAFKTTESELSILVEFPLHMIDTSIQLEE